MILMIVSLLCGKVMRVNKPLVLSHGYLWVGQIECVGEVVLSCHGLREAVGDVDLLRHCEVRLE